MAVRRNGADLILLDLEEYPHHRRTKFIGAYGKRGLCDQPFEGFGVYFQFVVRFELGDRRIVLTRFPRETIFPVSGFQENLVLVALRTELDLRVGKGANSLRQPLRRDRNRSGFRVLHRKAHGHRSIQVCRSDLEVIIRHFEEEIFQNRKRGA